MLEQLCGIPIKLNRKNATIEDDDTLLIAIMDRNLAAKDRVRTTIKNYEFFMCHYMRETGLFVSPEHYSKV